MATKYKRTTKTVNIILNAVKEGLTQREASVLAGISEDTLSLWKKDSDFSEQIRQKQIENKLRHIKVINEASKTHWQASAWYLERKYPDEYSLKTKLNLETNVKLEEMTETVKKILTPSKL